LRIAAGFFDRSDDTKTFKRGMDAYNNPGFYRQLGKQPQHVVTQALKTFKDLGRVGAEQTQRGSHLLCR